MNAALEHSRASREKCENQFALLAERHRNESSFPPVGQQRYGSAWWRAPSCELSSPDYTTKGPDPSYADLRRCMASLDGVMGAFTSESATRSGVSPCVCCPCSRDGMSLRQCGLRPSLRLETRAISNARSVITREGDEGRAPVAGQRTPSNSAVVEVADGTSACQPSAYSLQPTQADKSRKAAMVAGYDGPRRDAV